MDVRASIEQTLERATAADEVLNLFGHLPADDATEPADREPTERL